VATIFTVGHGTRTTEELIEVLRDAGGGRLIDVRRFPGSRRHPHFAREALETSMPAAGIVYEWRGEELGGRRSKKRGPSRHPAWRNAGFQAYADYMDTPEFRAGLQRLEADETSDPSVAIMCAESLWWRCHRRLISDALTLRGHDVIHLMRVGERERHKLHPAVRVDESGFAVYDVGYAGTLPV
jgi:uncharacterized protein (DUF488 family)